MAQKVLYNDSGRVKEIALSSLSVDLGNVTDEAQIAKSIVTTKGDIITATGNATPVRQGIGGNGQIIVADSNLTNGLGYKDPAFRNWVINGNFDIAQRGTSFTNPANATYTLDRVKLIYYKGSGSWPSNLIHSQQSLTPGDISNSFYFYRINTDGAGSSFDDNSYYGLVIPLEHATRYLCGDGKKVTVSFYARSSITSKKLGFYIQQIYGSGGSPTGTELITGTYKTLTSSWVKYSHTFTTNTLLNKTFGTNNNDRIHLLFFQQWGVNGAHNIGDTVAETFVGSGNIDIAQVALYAGDVAYPFEPKPYSQELFDCQYYCQVYDSMDDTFKVNIITGYDIHFQKQLLRPMRIKPFCTFLGTENTDYLVTNLNGTLQSGFTFNINPYTDQKSLYVIASKVSHGLTDARFMFSATGKIIADADF